MKKIKIFSSLIVVLSIISSCKKDFLEDIKSYDKYDESIFENEILTGWYVDRLYYDFVSAYKSPTLTVTGLYNNNRSLSTEEIGGTITDYINPQKTLVDASEADSYYGKALSASAQNDPYTRIRTANFLMEKIQEKGQALSEEFKTRVRGQMFFLRAYQYFDLVRVYGGVPLVTSTENASNTDPSIQHPRAKVSECVDQIVRDLDSAAAMLPMKWDAGNYGRFTAASALAMKSRVLLTFASPLYNTDWNSSGNARWQNALSAGLAAETALTSAGYGLYGSSAKEWAQMWYTPDNGFNKEAIMVQLLSKTVASSGISSNGWERSIRLSSQTGSGGIAAPKEMVDLFPMADGSRPIPGVNYDSTLFFMNRDPRFYRTFAFSGMKWPVKETTIPDVVWFYSWLNGSTRKYSDNNNVQSTAVVRKMSNPPNASTTDGLAYSGTDIFEYRYAELLLNIAECYAAKGDIANAVLYLGKIRQRVGIPAANNYGIGNPASKNAAIEAVLYERRVELAYEGKRFWDMQRWMLYNDDAGANNNTNAMLGVAPLNGTARTARLWQYKNAAGSADPLLAARTGISVDPDASAATFSAQLNALKTFYETNLKTVPTDQPMDRVGSTPVLIDFKQNYYISGLNSTALSFNPWLLQTIGWNGYSGGPGTFNFKD